MRGAFPAERLPRRRVGTMSKVELAGRPEPGYESMDQFTVSVEHVAEMLRTIDFQAGEGRRMGGGGRPRGPGVQRGAGGGVTTRERDSHLTALSLGPGASGEEEDEEVALEGEEGSAGPEEERPDGPEGECGLKGPAGLALRSGPLFDDGLPVARGSLGASQPPAGGARPLARVQKYTFPPAFTLGLGKTELGREVEEKPTGESG